METQDASAKISCDFAAQWDALSGTISCGANCSINAVLDGNHNCHEDLLSSDDACVF